MCLHGRDSWGGSSLGMTLLVAAVDSGLCHEGVHLERMLFCCCSCCFVELYFMRGLDRLGISVSSSRLIGCWESEHMRRLLRVKEPNEGENAKANSQLQMPS